MQEQEYQNTSKGIFSFDLITVFMDVLRRWYLIAAAALIVAMGAFVYSDSSYHPVYATNTTFVVSARTSANNVYQNLSATSDLASVFTEVLNSSILRSAVLNELGMTGFDGSISAAPIPDTNLLTLRVTASDPRTAFLVTRSVIENHGLVSGQVLGNTMLEVLQSPTVPAYPSNPRNSRAYAKKMAVFAVLGTTLVLMLASFLRDAVRSRSEAAEKLDCHILGEIHHEKKHKTFRSWFSRKKHSILVSRPDTSFHFVESIRKLCHQVEHRMGDKQVLLVTSVLENEGKSTIAANIAQTLARKGRRVLLIDADLRKPASWKILEKRPERGGTIPVITGHEKLEDCLVQDPVTGMYALLETHHVPSSTNLIGSSGMEQLLQQARARFELIILDLPPMSVAPDTEAVMDMVDKTLLVVRQNAATASRINSAAQILQGRRKKLLGVVLNNVYTTRLSASGYGYGYGYSGYHRYGKYNHYNHYGSYEHYAEAAKAAEQEQ